jgi:hypothetical protein
MCRPAPLRRRRLHPPRAATETTPPAKSAKPQFHHSAPACPSKVGAAFRRATPFQIPAKCIQWLPRTAPTVAERRLRSSSVLDDLCCQWQSHVPDSIAQLINTNQCPNTQATVCAGESAGESLTDT